MGDASADAEGISSVSLTADSSLCGGSLLGAASADAGFRLCGGEAVAFRSPPPPLRAPTYKLLSGQTLIGRGGSVSRRDHNQAYWRAPHLSGGTNSEEATSSNASRSSGERGLGGEGLLSEKPPLPPEFLTRLFYNIPSFDHRRRCAGSERASRLFRSWSGWGRCRDRPSRRAQLDRSRRLGAQRK